MTRKISKVMAIFTAMSMAIGPLVASAGTLGDYRERALDRAECPAYEGETQSECRDRLRDGAKNQNSDFRPTVDKSEIFTPSLSDPAYSFDGRAGEYNGEPGWASYGKDREQCGPGDAEAVCESGNNQSYENNARYEGDCEGGEDGCDRRIEGNENYDNEATYYGECGVGESPEECEDRLSGNGSYQNDARFYGSCPARPDETQEECEERLAKKGSNQNYQLNMDDFSGEGSDIYSGIPKGKGGNYNLNNGGGDPYSGIPNDRNQGSGKDWGNNGSGYKGERYDGDFAGYGVNQKDWDTLKNKQQEFNDSVMDNVNTDDLYKDKEKGNALLTLIFCHLQIPFEGVSKVYGDKTCRRAVKDLCSFSVRRMKISGPSQCVGFAPWNM